MEPTISNPSSSIVARQRALRAFIQSGLNQSINSILDFYGMISLKKDSNQADHENSPVKLSHSQHLQIANVSRSNFSPTPTENILGKRKSSPTVKLNAEFEASLAEIPSNTPRKQKEDFIIKTMMSKDYYSLGKMSACNSAEDLQKVVMNNSNVQGLQPENNKVQATTESPLKNGIKQEEQKRSQTVTKILVTANKTAQSTGQTPNIISVKKTSAVMTRTPETPIRNNATPPLQHKTAYGEPYRYGRTAQGARTKRATEVIPQSDFDVEKEALLKVRLDFDDRTAGSNDNTNTMKEQRNVVLNRFGFQRGTHKKSLDGSSKHRNLSPNNLRENGVDKIQNIQATLNAYEKSNRIVRIQLTRVGPRPMLKAPKNLDENFEPVGEFQTTQRRDEGFEVKTRIEEFAIEKVLGQGSYAVVKLARDKRTNQKYAIKTYERFKLYDTQRRKNVRLEISILKGLDHPNIIKLYYTILNTTQINLVMELGGQQSLYSYLKTKEGGKLDEEEARSIFKQLVEGTKYLHERNIAHRDLKLENILIDNDKTIKIIDFGFSVQVQKSKLLTVCCGTPTYMAPELANRKDYDGISVDLWALGIILYAMVAGKLPFKGDNDRDLCRKISRCSFERIKDASIEAQGLIGRILKFNPQERLTAAQILEDNWIKGQQNSHQEFNNFISGKLLEYKNNQKHLRTSSVTSQDQ